MKKHKPTKSELNACANATTSSIDGIKYLLSTSETQQEKDFFNYVIDTFDFGTYAEIQKKHLQKKSRPIKFLDFPRWIKARYDLAVSLELDHASPLNILDIGCGPGHFGYVCRYFGHEVLGIDVPDVEIFNDLVEILGTQRIADPVTPMTPLPKTKRFHFVTALSANFYRKADNTLYTLEEWKYFLDDTIVNHMRPKGKIYLHLNLLEHVKGMHYFDAEFIKFIEKQGGNVNVKNGVVRFANVDLWNNY